MQQLHNIPLSLMIDSSCDDMTNKKLLHFIKTYVEHNNMIILANSKPIKHNNMIILAN